MPPELGSALSIEREAVTDPGIRVQVLDAIYLLVLQVNHELLRKPKDNKRLWKWKSIVVPGTESTYSLS